MRPKLLMLIPALALSSTYAHAVSTRTFELDSLEKLSGGDLAGVSVGSDGVVRAGWTLGSVALPDATATWCAAELPDHSVLIGVTGGQVFRVAGGVATVFADTHTDAVTALAVGPGGVAYAGTIPDAKLFKLGAGKAEPFATLPDSHNVWALVFDKAGLAGGAAFYAATGPDGRLFRVALDGTASVYFHSDEPNLVSVAVAANGDVYTGSGTRGLLYRLHGAGRASVLYDFPGEAATEVRSLAVAGNALYVAVNEYSELPEPPKRATAGRSEAGPAAQGTRPKPGKGTLYRFDAQGRPEKMMHHDDFHYMSLAVDDGGTPYVGTGVEGRVYSVDDAHKVTLVADTDERQIGALVLTGGVNHGAVKGLIASSDPGVAHPILGRGGVDAVWTSKPLDSGLRARFGRVTWQSKGSVEVTTRTGDTASPDATWSNWSGPLPLAGVVQSPAARYFQVRARWSGDPNAELSDILIPFVTDNLRAVVTEVSAQPKPVRDTKEGLIASGSEPPRHDSSVKLTFKVDNPDGDDLRFRVTYRRDGDPLWREVTRPDEVQTKTDLDWETSALPEGRYRVRVSASDELANPPETTTEHSLESPTFIVDNTPPVFQGLALRGRRLVGRVVDGVGPIARVELVVDSHADWHPLAPADGIFDSADEALDADVHALVPAGSHLVTVRAFDAAGNSVVATLTSGP
jgi:hypothetical protein